MSIVVLLLAAQVTSEPIDGNRFRLSISDPKLASIASAQLALQPTARRLCGARTRSFGSFRINPPKIEQELFCGPAKLSDAASAPPPGWQPSPTDQQAVLAATYSYLAAKDRGRAAEAWSMLSSGMKGISPAAEWQQGAAAFNTRAGPVRARRVTEITWYNNPPDARQPGLYVAADVSGEFEKLDFVCGYVMWRVEAGGSLAVTREEQNVLDKATAKNLASIDRQPLRVQMGCKD